MTTLFCFFFQQTHHYSLPFEEANVENGRVKVNELKKVHFESKRVLVFCGGPVELCVGRKEESVILILNRHN